MERDGKREAKKEESEREMGGGKLENIKFRQASKKIPIPLCPIFYFLLKNYLM